MPFCAEDALAGLWSAAGLGDVHVAGVVVDAAYEGFEDLWAPLETGVGPSGAYVAALAAADRAAFKDELRRRLGAGDAPFRLGARAWIATGHA